MYKVCKTERSAQRQRMIENTLLSLMKKSSYDSITITELCEAAGIPRKAFYRYFESKDAALHGLVEHNLSDYHMDRVDPTVPRSLLGELEQFFIFWYEKKELLDVLNKNELLGIIITASTEFPIGNMISLQRLLPDDDDRMRVLVFKFAIGGLISVMLDWYHGGFVDPVSDIAKRAVRILSKPPFPNLDKIGITELPV